jgi:1-acyl-sn-glycerol-3-phosphate acyltransferase
MLDVLFSLYCWFSVAGVTAVLYLPGHLPLWMLTRWFDPTHRICHWYCTFWARSLMAVNQQWRMKVVHVERLPKDRPVILVSNHLGMGDILLLYRLTTQFRWIAKEIIFKVPLLGWSMAHAGYIRLRRGDRDSARHAMEQSRWYLERGVSVLIFPEGTRSRDGKLLPFKQGAFRLALETGCDILPMGIAGTEHALPSDSWKFPRRVSRMRLVIGEPIRAADFGESNVQGFVDHTRQVIEALKAEAEGRESPREQIAA